VSNESHPNSRRNFLKSGLIAISTAALPATTVAAAAVPTPSPNPQPTRFLNEPERHFLESAVDRLIPPDGKWPDCVAYQHIVPEVEPPFEESFSVIVAPREFNPFNLF